MSLTYDVLKDDVRAGRPIDFGFVTYVPERTCRNASLDPLDFKCSECGAEDYVDGGTIVWVDGGPQDASYCPHCGARVVKEEA